MSSIPPLRPPPNTLAELSKLWASGVRSLELDQPEEKECRSRHSVFLANFRLQHVCPTCVAKRQAESEAMQAKREEDEEAARLAALGLSGRRASMTFGSFFADRQPEAYDAVRLYADTWPVAANLVLLGTPGSGKTHLCCALARRLYKDRVDVRYVQLPALSASLRAAEDWSAALRHYVEPLHTCGLLILDDVGREKAAASYPEMFDKLIDERYNAGLPLVLAANLSEEKLFGDGTPGSAWLSPASASRLVESVSVVKMRDRDFRVHG